jgi:hypothetical protein
MRKIHLILSVILLAALLLAACSPGAKYGDYSSVTADSIRSNHQALYNIATKAGGLDSGIRLNDAGTKAADYILAAYKNAGLKNARQEEFFPLRWWPDKYEAVAFTADQAEGKKLTAFPLWYCEGIDNQDLDLVYVGYGTPGEWQGVDTKDKVVLMDMKRIMHFIPSWQNTMGKQWALYSGAKAIILADTLVDSPSGISAGHGGTINNQKGEKAELYTIPGFSIGKSDGDFLRNALKSGQVKVRLNLKYSMDPGRAVNVVGELPGNGKIDEYIVIGGHYDTWFNGAIDNLGSQASMIEMAKYIAGIPQSERNRNIIFVSLFGHEYGGETSKPNAAMGHAAFVEKHPELANKVTCFLDIDGSGSWGYEEKDNSGVIYATNKDDKAGIFATSWALTEMAGEGIQKYAKGPWGQYPISTFVADLAGPVGDAGWPCLMIISKHIYYHSLLDTMEKITPDQVYRRTLMNLDIIKKLLDSPAGFIQAIDGNPKKVRDTKDIKNVSVQVIPTTIKAGSMVIVWPGYWEDDLVIRPDGFVFDFGDRTPPVLNKVATGHVYDKPGTYTITMTANDIAGRTGVATQNIEVIP